MKIQTSISIIIWLSVLNVAAQHYQSEVDITATGGKFDGAEMQLIDSDGDHFVRFFAGSRLFPKPFLYFSDTDTFHIMNGNASSTSFSQLFTLQPNGNLGLGIDHPKSNLHISGNLTTPWAMKWNHYQTTFGSDNQFLPWLSRNWNGSLWDHLYIGTTGNRNNSRQPAMILSGKKGFLLGRGHNDADQLSEEHLKIDSSGSVTVSDLAGTGFPRVLVDSSGNITTANALHTLNLSATSFKPTSVNSSTTWVSHVALGAYYRTAPLDCLVWPPT